MADEVCVTIAHPDGVSMKFSESLSAFILKPRLGRFSTGDWLQTLSGGELSAFIEMGRRWCDGEESIELDDYLAALLHAIAAEKKATMNQMPPDELFTLGASLLHIASLEANRRNGFVSLNCKLRLFPGPKDSITVTDKGLQQAEEWKRQLH